MDGVRCVWEGKQAATSFEPGAGVWRHVGRAAASRWGTEELWDQLKQYQVQNSLCDGCSVNTSPRIHEMFFAFLSPYAAKAAAVAMLMPAALNDV